MYFIAGITGNVGGAAATRLLQQGKQVRTLARDPQKAAAWAAKGVEVQPGDLTDVTAVTHALNGVEGAFLLIPPMLAPSPDYNEAKAALASYTEAMRTASPPRLVCLSSVGSEQASGLGNITTTHLMEQAFADLPFPVAFVRAGSFFENFAGGITRAQAEGTLGTFYAPTSRAVPMIATADIGNLVSDLLTGAAWQGRRVIELGTMHSPDEMAAALSAVLGKPVAAQAPPREARKGILTAMGMPADRTGVFEEMVDGINSGWIHFGVPGTEAVAGTTTPQQFFTALTGK